MVEPLTLTKIDGARQALLEAKDLGDVKTIHDQAEAMRQYARAQKMGLEAQNHAAEITLLAERRGGDLLKAMKVGGQRQSLGRPKKTSHDTTFSESHDSSPTLADIGISRDQSSRWQQVAAIPEPLFVQHVAETKARGDELTTAGVIRAAKAAQSEQAKGDAKTMAKAIDNIARQSPEVMAAHTGEQWNKAITALYIMTNLDAAVVSERIDALDAGRHLDCIRSAVAWLQSLEFEIENRAPWGGLVGAR